MQTALHTQPPPYKPIGNEMHKCTTNTHTTRSRNTPTTTNNNNNNNTNKTLNSRSKA